MNSKSLYVIIPNFNGKSHLDDCLHSLRQQTFKDFGIIMVDNASSDGSVNHVAVNFPEVAVIQMTENTGFARAVNEGIRAAMKDSGCGYVVLLNNDTECDVRFLEELIVAANADGAGSGACKMLNFYNRKIIDDAGDFIKHHGSPYARGFGEPDSGQFNKPEYIFGACAGAAIYRAEVFLKAGYFDEEFFAYYEDVDFSFRLQLAGYKCFYNPLAVCYHKRGATTSAMSGFQTMLCEKNLIALRLKNYPAGLYSASFIFFALVRIKRYAIFFIRHSPSLCFSAIKGYLKGLSEIPSSLRKRRQIQGLKVVSNSYIKSILTK